MSKSPEITKFLDEMTSAAFGRTRSESLSTAMCVTCGGEASEFRDDLSRREYKISGMCQTCQDSVFGSSEDD